MDVRQVYEGMLQSIKSKDHQLLYKTTMAQIWFKDSMQCNAEQCNVVIPQSDKCGCGRDGVRIYHMITGNFTTPLDLSIPTRAHKFVERRYCENMCYLNDVAHMIPAVKAVIDFYKDGFKKKKADKMEGMQHQYDHLCQDVQYSTIRIDLKILMETAIDKYKTKKVWPQLKDVLSQGFQFDNWTPLSSRLDSANQKVESGDKKNLPIADESKFRFCWYPMCPSQYHELPANVNLKVCRGCRKARYCREECALQNWSEHRVYCVNAEAKRLLQNG